MSDHLDVGKARAQHQVRLDVRKALENEVPGLAQEPDVASCVDMSELVRRLSDIAKSSDATRRRDAARALGATSACSPQLAQEAEPSLLNLLVDPSEAVRLAAVQAIGRRGLSTSPRAVEALVDQSLSDPMESVVLATLDSLQGCDPLAASRAVPALINMLAESEGSMQVKAAVCRALGELGSHAIEAIPELLRVSLDTPQVPMTDLVRAAASAIARIDPGGASVVAAAEALKDLERLRDLLLTIGGTSERPLVEQLIRQIASLRIGSPTGRRRMYMRDIITVIFGSKPGNADTRRKKILSWLEAKTLPGMKISQGMYDVDAAALQVLRQRHLRLDDAETQ